MANSLQKVLGAIASSTTERELQIAIMETVGEHFDVQRWGIYLFDEQPQVRVNAQGFADIPEVCLRGNPVGKYVVERHAPAHEQLILPGGDWKDFCTRDDHAHVMSGPIVADGCLVGTLNLARATGNPAFTANDLADLSALCLHLSAKLASLRAKSKVTLNNSALASRLTPRELEIAELVAQGLTNSEIGEKLWITQNSVKQALKRMFRKLEVSARAEMVAKLQEILSSKVGFN
ncbi:LuxR C-terminal-related transcriptional regulator [Calothrix sp. UHCC 0171]|uniref:LuxR C-terminal-related transcriptional regulator n=1 Tax=Calothrix sp. UHCC 0171 TaxID=3110245 RepID=UPI002B208972|nr:LuxR C-terminal-related transcriptional regulator [Calothrix sp. UHCC 0171]MEA5572184.1 LuxR C-terminal-related transcriptional regulator [Calothrix sp. UHCC 0171]